MNLLWEHFWKVFTHQLARFEYWVMVTSFLLLEKLKQHNVAIASWRKSIDIHEKQKNWGITLASCRNSYSKVFLIQVQKFKYGEMVIHNPEGERKKFSKS